MKGFYFYTPSKEYFFVTEQQKRTEKFCKAVEDYLVNEEECRFVRDGKYHGAFGTFSIKDKLQAATCEVKHTDKFGDYFDIAGDGFTAGHFVSENKTKLIVL